MGWRGYIDKEHNTVFYWSQKAACTTLFHFLAENMENPPERKRYFMGHSPRYWTCEDYTRRFGMRTVILVRHPVSRIISAYFNKFCFYKGVVLRTRTHLEPFAKDLFDVWRDRTGHEGEENVMTFEQFLDTVEHLHATRPDIRETVNGHWDTQVPPEVAKRPDRWTLAAKPPFLHRVPGVHYDHVVRVENFDAEIAALAERLGMRYTPRRMNSTDLPDGTPHTGYLGDVPARRVASHTFAHENFINDAVLARIGRIYADDFRIFGYDLKP